MSEFNRMTIVAAAEVVSSFHTHSGMDVLEMQWGIAGRCSGSNKLARVADWGKIACDEEIEVLTESGQVHLSRAMVETAISAPDRDTSAWKRLIAGLRLDGFEVRSTHAQDDQDEDWPWNPTETSVELVRMLPSAGGVLDAREANDEVTWLLVHHGFVETTGHLTRALSAFSRGEWSSANGELRNFYESYLSGIATALGYRGSRKSKHEQDYLGDLQPPFLLAEYNEWNSNIQKPQFVQGLMSRMHPHGGHPGLSVEEDATFRLQISLVTARLFLRRFDQRVRTSHE